MIAKLSSSNYAQKCGNRCQRYTWKRKCAQKCGDCGVIVSPLLQKNILYTSCTCREYYARLSWNVRKSAVSGSRTAFISEMCAKVRNLRGSLFEGAPDRRIMRESAERWARSSEESTPGPGRKAKSIPSEGFICGIVAEPGSWAGAEWHQEQESGLNRDGPFRSGQLDFRKTFLPWKIFSQKAGFFRQMKHHIRIGADVEKGFVC